MAISKRTKLVLKYASVPATGVGIILFFYGNNLFGSGNKLGGALIASLGLALSMFAAGRGYVARPCGHGRITQGRLGIHYPWVVKKCPVCGDIFD